VDFVNILLFSQNQTTPPSAATLPCKINHFIYY